MGIFGLVKKALRRFLREYANAQIGLKPSKLEVITAFQRTREEVMTPQVIRNAWETAGIWLRGREKPLSSRFVILHEKGVARKAAEAAEGSERPKTPTFLEIVNPVPVVIPSSGQEIFTTGRKLAISKTRFSSACQRLWNIKAAKALDTANATIADLTFANLFLQAKVDWRKNNTQKAVKIAPGHRFVRMADIRRAKRRVRSRTIYEDDAATENIPGRGRRASGRAWEDVTKAESSIEVHGRRQLAENRDSDE